MLAFGGLGGRSQDLPVFARGRRFSPRSGRRHTVTWRRLLTTTNEQGRRHMTKLQHRQQKLAVLFDAANISYTLTRPILQRAANYGVLSVKRA